jgi:TolB protein
MKTWGKVRVTVTTLSALVAAAGCVRNEPHAWAPGAAEAPIPLAEPAPTLVTVNTSTTVNNPAPAFSSPPTTGAATQASAGESSFASDPSSIRDLPVTTNISRVTFAEEGSDFDPCVSKDGSKIVFASTQHRATSDIYIKRTDSRVVTQLTNDPAQDSMPSISPDGGKIAFTSDRSGNWDIYVMPTTGGKAVQITSDGSDEIHPSWSADGKQLVFCRMGQASGRWEMWTTEVQNPSVESFIGYGLFPQWCPVAGTGEAGADRILYQVGRERGRRAFGVWTIDITPAGSTNATEIASSSTTALINPAWSPDGKWIVYAEVPISPAVEASAATDSNSRRAPGGSLWMLSIEGDGKVRLTSGPSFALSPTWGANNRLFFVCDRSGSENVWSLDINPAVAAAQATLGASNQPVTAQAPAHATPTTPPAIPASKPDAVANVPEGEQPSNVQPH